MRSAFLGLLWAFSAAMPCLAAPSDDHGKLCRHWDKDKLAALAAALDRTQNRDAAGKPIVPGMASVVFLIRHQRWQDSLTVINSLHLKMFVGQPSDGAAFTAMQLGVIVNDCRGQTLGPDFSIGLREHPEPYTGKQRHEING